MNKANKRYVIPVLIIALLAGMVILAGCSDDDDPVRVVSEPIVRPETADELMNQFRSVYEALDVNNYLALLDPGFLMILQEETIWDFPRLGGTLDYQEEERIHRRMFSGELVTDPEGTFVPGVQRIEFSILMALTEWAPSDNKDIFPDTEWAAFAVNLLFDRGESYSTMKAEGTLKIYVRAHEVEVDGTNKTYYMMAGMEELSNVVKSTESASWGGVKALYR